MKGPNTFNLNNLDTIKGNVNELSYQEFKGLMTHFRRPASGMYENITAFLSNLFNGKFFDNLTVADPINGTFHTLDKNGSFIEDLRHQNLNFQTFFENEKVNGKEFKKVFEQCDQNLAEVEEMQDKKDFLTAEVILTGVFSNLIDSKMMEYRLATSPKFASRVDALLKFVGEMKAPFVFSNCSECLVFGNHSFKGKKLGMEINKDHYKTIESIGIIRYWVHDLVSIFGIKGQQDLLLRLHKEKGVLLTVKDSENNNIFHTMFANMEQLKNSDDKSRDATEGFRRILESFKDEEDLYNLLLEENSEGKTPLEIASDRGFTSIEEVVLSIIKVQEKLGVDIAFKNQDLKEQLKKQVNKSIANSQKDVAQGANIKINDQSKIGKKEPKHSSKQAGANAIAGNNGAEVKEEKGWAARINNNREKKKSSTSVNTRG